MPFPALLLLAPPVVPLLQEEPIELVPGEAFQGEMTIGRFGDGYASFVVDAPAQAVALELVLSCAQTDLDLYVTCDSGPFEGETLVSTGFGVERVVFDGVSEVPLRTARYLVEVDCVSGPRPTWEGRRISSVSYEVEARLHEALVEGALEAGVPVEGRIEGFARRTRTYTVEVPEGASALRLDVLDTPGDVDLWLRRGEPIRREVHVEHEAAHAYGRETLVVTPESRPRLRPGTWYVDVVDFGARDGRVPFRLLATLAPEPPPVVLELPVIPARNGDDPIARGAAAVVDLYAADSQGSGTLLSPEGWILTNAHVVSDFRDDPQGSAVVGVQLGLARPPVELFRAEVVEFDWARDLALLRVTSGLHGQPLPEGYRFPFVERAPASELRLGQELWIAGYPWIGGSGGRVSLTLTRGVLCGYEETAAGVLLKTDAGVSQGNSGGAALDALGRLVGVPTTIMESGSSQISFLVQPSSMPEAWLGHLE